MRPGGTIMSKRDDFWSRGPGEPPRLFAHRGNSGAAFENTVSAYILAAEAGVDGIEIDVSCTADGELICFHDANLKRISGSRQRVRDMRFRTLRSIPLEGNERIPTLNEAFEAIPPSTSIILDIKTSGMVDGEMIDILLGFLKKTSFEEQRRIAVSSFNYLALKALAKRSPDLRLGFILRADSVHSKIGMNRIFSRNYRMIHPQASLVTRKAVSAWHEAGFDVIPWTVNERIDAIKITGDGADGIISDYAPSLHDL
jgi:glycerophosphoryl diester phosphodiesterase